MNRLTPDAVAAIKGKKKITIGGSDAAQLISELSHIAQSIISSSQASFSKWSLTCNTIGPNDGNFACIFTTAHEKNQAVQLKLQVNANGDSFLEAGVDTQEADNQGLMNQLSQFMNTPAAKRYFEIPVKGIAKIKATIPRREVVSRYFEDYVRHLICQLEPFINSMVSYQM